MGGHDCISPNYRIIISVENEYSRESILLLDIKITNIMLWAIVMIALGNHMENFNIYLVDNHLKKSMPLLSYMKFILRLFSIGSGRLSKKFPLSKCSKCSTSPKVRRRGCWKKQNSAKC